MGLNERKVKAVLYVVENGSITNAKYQELFSVSKPTATRDLSELSEKFRVFEKRGVTWSRNYVLMGSSHAQWSVPVHVLTDHLVQKQEILNSFNFY